MGALEDPFVYRLLEEISDDPKGATGVTESVSGRYSRLPQELKDSPQWCIAGPDKAPYVVTANNVVHASIQRREHWKTFDAALADAALAQAPNVGFVLTFEDPWVCIDLDVCNAETQRLKGEPNDPSKWSTVEQIQRFQSIVDTFDSYTEISTLGWGLHIWVKGRIGLGVKRDGVEIYSQERFMICTGNVYVDKPIEYRQDLLDNMVSQLRGPGYSGPEPLVEIEQTENDMEVFERANTAANATKFNTLCSGEWKLDYPSQSEADLALMSIICFYSKSNEQCRRIFRCTTLGQRAKATKNDRYLNYTLELIRSRQAREAVISEDGKRQAQEFIRKMQGTDYADIAAVNVAIKNTEMAPIGGTIDWPPGLAGALAGFIYNSSPRPVKEVAIVAALGFLAGVCGKAFNIPQSGLNMYIILVARSGVGKEAMHSGLSLVLEELRHSLPAAQKFVDFNDFASGPALVKAAAQNSSFVNVAGEWGRKLRRLSEDARVDGPMWHLRTVMTNLYQKSGFGNMVGGITYSNQENNISSLTGVAYSMIGESTPGMFYDSLTPAMMEDGFLSRFLVIDYDGDRPALNRRPQRKMHTALGQALHGLCAQALTIIQRFGNEQVQFDSEATALLECFDIKCDVTINATDDESIRQMWNRAHLKVMRLAALLAVGDNWLQPVVTLKHAEWALSVVNRDIAIMSRKLGQGDIGLDENSRERKLAQVLIEYSKGGIDNGESYGVPESLINERIITRRYLQIRLANITQFKASKEGSTRSLDYTIKLMIETGYLVEVEKSYLVLNHGYHGKSYRILGLPTAYQ